MKKSFLIVFLIVNLNMLAQTTTFHRVYTDSSFSYSTYYNRIIRTIGDNFLITGLTASYSKNKNIIEPVLTKLDKNCTIKWMFKYNYSNNDIISIKVIKELANGNFLLAGDFNYKAGWLMKIDSLGNILWANLYDSCSIGSVEIIDNRYYLSGLHVNRSNTFIIKTDTSGKIIWSKTIASYNDLIWSTCIFNNEIIMTGAAKSVKADSAISYGVFATRIDTNGKVKWMKGYNLITRGGTPLKIIKTIDDYFIISFMPQDRLNSYQGLMKIDSEGNIIWCKEYHTLQKTNETHGRGLIELENGDIISTAVMFISNTNFTGLILKTNNEGKLIWQRHIDHPEPLYNIQLLDIVKSKRNELLFVGNVYQSSPVQVEFLYLLQTDSTGFTKCGNESSIDTWAVDLPVKIVALDSVADISVEMSKINIYATNITPNYRDICLISDVNDDYNSFIIKNDFWIGKNYPNPFNNQTAIPYYISDATVKAEIIICDLTGRVLKTGPLNNKETQVVIQLEDLQVGIYTYSLEINNTIFETKKMVLIK